MSGLRPDQARTRGPSLTWALIGAALGGAGVGAIDALWVARVDSLPGDPARVAELVGAQALSLGASVGLLTLPILVALRGRRSGTLGALLGIGLALALDLCERALRAPPPFAEPPLLHAHPSLLGLALLVGLAGVVGLARMSRAPRWGRLSLPLALALATLALSRPDRSLAPRGSAAGGPPVVLVTLDTTRDDHVGPDNPYSRTPTMDALARDGARFSLALSQIPVTGPSHTTILSGEGPWSHGVLLNGHPIPAELPLLAEVLRGQGYDTGAFISAYVLEGTFGFARGFQVYDDDFGAVQGWADTVAGRLMAGVQRHLDPELSLERRADRTVDHALAWLDRPELASGQTPFFLWVHLFDPHGPYEPPSPWDRAYYQGDPRDPARKTMSRVQNVAPYLLSSLAGITDLAWPLAQYAGEISYADQELGRLITALDQRYPEALVIVSGDHGESLGEHGVWFNHGDDLFEPATRVPLVMRMRDRIAPGSVVSSPVELLDIAPTTLDLLGLPSIGEGRSLAAWVSADPPADPPHLFARSFTYDRPSNIAARRRGETGGPQHRMVALRALEGRYVLREAPGEGEAWYDLQSSSDERQPSALPGSLASALRASADALLRGQDRPAADALDAETRERLRQLGYVDE